jgi:heme-degrading monooxygenase HmoA
MFTRIFRGKLNPSVKMEAQEVIDSAILRVKELDGFLLLQYLEGKDDFIVITTWASQQDMEAYASSGLAKEIHESLKPYLTEEPLIRSYGVKTNINAMWA